MEWVLVFPTYRIIHEVVQNKTTYLVLMNLSIIMPFAFMLILSKGIGAASASQTTLKSIAATLVALLAGAAVVYYALFTDFGLITTELIGNVLDFFSRSPLAFGIFYCLGFPALLGVLLLVALRSLNRIVRGNHKSKTAQ